ncbi:MAG: glycosyltransferase family 1 protein [Betaproteobacteria bacterium]|nr:glycosyltransferase family 1 protein [Betaproteobacteria bacterium]
MRLAIVRQRYNPYGGAERFVERAIHALRERGVGVTVLARQWHSGAPSAEAESDHGPDADVVRCDPFFLGSIWRDAGFAHAACRHLEALRVDLVQSHERIACCDVFRAGDGVHAQWLANRQAAGGALLGLSVRLNPYHRYTLAAERRLFASPRLRAVICNSHMVKKEIHRWFGTDEGKLHVIYNGVDLDAFHPRLKTGTGSRLRARLGIAPDAPVFLFVGGGFERKGVPRLLQAFAQSAPADAWLLIVGGDRHAPRFARQATAMGRGGRVHFAGAQDDVRPWYGASDCFVLPTLYDPFPNAALEAMASGLPIITTHQCGAAELIEHGKTGFVCDALDIAALGAALQWFNRSTAELMGARARERVMGFGLSDMGERLLELYRSLLDSPVTP